MLTANGRISWSRRRWSGGNAGSDCPVDKLVDETETAVSVGVRQLCCREGTQARSFARGRENLKHAAQLDAGEELFRQIVESEGKAVLQAAESGQLELDWSGAQCVAQTPAGPEHHAPVRQCRRGLGAHDHAGGEGPAAGNDQASGGKTRRGPSGGS